MPRWDPDTTGGFFRLTLRHGRGHLARAVYEGIALSLARVAEALAEAVEPIQEVRVTGGLLGSPTWLRIAADVFGARFYVPETAEGSALGAAVLAWVALGQAPDLSVARDLARPRTWLEPDLGTHRFYREHLKKADRLLQAVKATRG